MSTNEIHPDLDEVLDEWSANLGTPKTQIIQQIDAGYGLDLSAVSDDDAQKFAQAYRDGDVEAVKEVLRDNDVEEDTIEQFENVVMAEMGDDAGEEVEERGNGHGPDTEVSQTSTESDPGGASGDTEYLTRSEAEQMMESFADKVAERIQPQGQQAPAQGAQGAQGGQNQTQAVLAQELAKRFLNDTGGQSGAAVLGEKFQQKAMESAMQKMFAPDPFDIMRMKWANKQAEEYLDDEELQEMMGAGMFDVEESDDDEDSSSGGLWKFGGN